jgi:hypothetical protein
MPLVTNDGSHVIRQRSYSQHSRGAHKAAPTTPNPQSTTHNPTEPHVMPATKCATPPVITLTGGAIGTYSDAIQGAGFSVENPNSQWRCGCGQSCS